MVAGENQRGGVVAAEFTQFSPGVVLLRGLERWNHGWWGSGVKTSWLLCEKWRGIVRR